MLHVEDVLAGNVVPKHLPMLSLLSSGACHGVRILEALVVGYWYTITALLRELASRVRVRSVRGKLRAKKLQSMPC